MSNGNGNIIRKHTKDKDFTVIDNNIFKNTQLSLKAKGLITMMLSFQDNWEFSINGLVSRSKDGVDSVRSGLNELEEHGYLKREYPRETGQFSQTIFHIFEIPTISEKPYTGKPTRENHIRETPYNKELNNKELNNKELSNKDIYSEVVDYLNFMTTKKYKLVDSVKSSINARLNEGYTLDDFKTVIDKKCVEWSNTEMSKYLRPQTLFGTKFDSYLNQEVKPKRNNYDAMIFDENGMLIE